MCSQMLDSLSVKYFGEELGKDIYQINIVNDEVNHADWIGLRSLVSGLTKHVRQPLVDCSFLLEFAEAVSIVVTDSVQWGDPCLHGGGTELGCQSQRWMIILVASVREDGGVPHDMQLVIVNAALGRHRETPVLKVQCLFFRESDRGECLTIWNIPCFDPFRTRQLLFVAILLGILVF